jgi:predicted nucleic-acid-binding protein
LTLKDAPEEFEAARELVDRTGVRFMVADTAVIEYVYALEHYYELEREQVAEMANAVLALPMIHASGALFAQALALYTKRPRLSFEDCYLAERARAEKALPLYTFNAVLAAQSDAAQGV